MSKMQSEGKSIDWPPERTIVYNENSLENYLGIKVESFRIVKDPKTGKVLRINDTRTLSEMNEDKYKRLLENTKKTADQERM